MDKKITILLVAIISGLIFISPMAAAENNALTTYALFDFNPFGNTNEAPFEIENLKILKVNKKHTYSNGNVKKSTKYYLKFNVKTDADSLDKYDVKIKVLDKKNKTIKTVKASIDHDGKYNVPLKKVSKVKGAKLIVYNENGDKILSEFTKKIKVTKKVTKDKPAPKKESTSTSSSSSSSGTTYWGSSKSGKFHYPSCEWGQKIYSGNKVVFHSREEAISAGYSPCQVCGP